MSNRQETDPDLHKARRPLPVSANVNGKKEPEEDPGERQDQHRKKGTADAVPFYCSFDPAERGASFDAEKKRTVPQRSAMPKVPQLQFFIKYEMINKVFETFSAFGNP